MSLDHVEERWRKSCIRFAIFLSASKKKNLLSTWATKMEYKSSNTLLADLCDFEKEINVMLHLEILNILLPLRIDMANILHTLHTFFEFTMSHWIRQIGRAVQQECRDRSRMPSSA
eukprot:TRINITY_DN26170_c0_g1_i1.p1 TRINITY_DN26170_c0_g1~~TRINITY_DN26170_c0_g1_i1.p1  ORF type:complete len:116 (-),score=17.28 TRINITY_DN26170_c0_g1_i1:20-367(-)